MFTFNSKIKSCIINASVTGQTRYSLTSVLQSAFTSYFPRRLTCFTVGSLIALAASNMIYAQENAAKEQHATLGLKEKSDKQYHRTTHPDAQWFPEAGLGLFIHWGISSVHGGIDLSWGMMAEKPWDPKDNQTITPIEYFALAKSFNPSLYNPDKWLKAAKAAGFRYVVMTAKHHDGFAMWPSDYGDFGVKQFLPGVDLVKEFIEACRRNGLKCGLYYSPPDWYFNKDYMTFHYGSEVPDRFPGRKHFGLHHEPIDTLPTRPAELSKNYRDYVRGQVTELLTHYGKVDIIWFDGGPEVISMDEIHKLQPGILVNPRMHGYGDFKTPEMEFPKKPLEGWWEFCEIWHHGGWAYMKSSETYQPVSWFLTHLIRCRAWGGNYLPDVGPRPTGEMPDAYYQEMSEIAAWMNVNKESIFGVKPGPYPSVANVPVTTKDKTWYLFLLPEHPADVLVSDDRTPQSIQLLGSPKNLDFTVSEGKIQIPVSDSMVGKSVGVLKIAW